MIAKVTMAMAATIAVATGSTAPRRPRARCRSTDRSDVGWVLGPARLHQEPRPTRGPPNARGPDPPLPSGRRVGSPTFPSRPARPRRVCPRVLRTTSSC
jgi:hypothetical protein